MSPEITQRVISVIAKTQHLERDKITPESTFQDLGIDSLDGINIAFGLENEFDINIPDDALPQLKSIGDIVGGVEKLLAEKGAP